MGYWDWLSDFGQVAGQGAASAAAGRKTEAELGIDQDRLRLTDLALRQKDAQDRAQLELQQKQYGLTAPKTRTQSAALGDLLSNVQDVRVNRPAGVPTGGISGGLRPSALGANARAAGQELSRQSLDALMSGKDTSFAPVPALQSFTPSPIPKASGWEQFLGKAGQGGSLAGALLGAGKAAAGGNGGESGGNLDGVVGWLKNLFTPQGDAREKGYVPGNEVDPGYASGPGSIPGDWADLYANPDFWQYTPIDALPTGLDGQDSTFYPGMPGGDPFWETPPPPVPAPYDPYNDPYYWF